MKILFLIPNLSEIPPTNQLKDSKKISKIHKSISKNKNHNRYLLPVVLINKLKSIFTSKEMNLAVKVLVTLRKKAINGKVDDEDYLTLCKNYKKKLVGSSNNYKIIYKPMLENDILQKKILDNGKTFSTSNRQCCQYRINPQYLKGKREEITYTVKLVKSKS